MSHDRSMMITRKRIADNLVPEEPNTKRSNSYEVREHDLVLFERLINPADR